MHPTDMAARKVAMALAAVGVTAAAIYLLYTFGGDEESAAAPAQGGDTASASDTASADGKGTKGTGLSEEDKVTVAQAQELLKAGDKAGAAKLLQKIQEKHMAQVMELSERSKALIEKGEHAAAVPLYEQIYHLMLEKLGESHPSVLMHRVQQALLMSKAGQKAEGKAMLEESTRKLISTGTQLLLKSGTAQGINQSAQIFSFVVEVMESSFAEQGGHPMVCEVKVLLARAILALGDEDKATKVLEQGTQQLLDLSGAYSEQGEEGLESALNMSKSFSQLIMTLFGKDHPLSLEVLHHTASLMHLNADLDDAKKLFETLLPKQEEQLGAEALGSLMSKFGLAAVMLDLGEIDEAAPVIAAMVESFRKEEFGPLLPKYARAFNGLVLKVQGKPAEAETEFAAAVAMDGDNEETAKMFDLMWTALQRDRKSVV